MNFKDCYMSLMTYRKPPEVETMRRAEMQLATTIDDLKEKETTLRGDLATLAKDVKRAQAANAGNKVKQLVTSSAAKRANLSLTTRKRMALEQQLDAIATTQLNQQVLSSMKQTSNALKSLGLDSTLNSVDEVMSDMQEANTDINEITQTLSGSLTYDAMDDDALQAELDLLLGDEVDSIVQAPSTVNSTHMKEQPSKTAANPSTTIEAKEEPVEAENQPEAAPVAI